MANVRELIAVRSGRSRLPRAVVQLVGVVITIAVVVGLEALFGTDPFTFDDSRANHALSHLGLGVPMAALVFWLAQSRDHGRRPRVGPALVLAALAALAIFQLTEALSAVGEDPHEAWYHPALGKLHTICNLWPLVVLPLLVVGTVFWLFSSVRDHMRHA